MNKAVEELYKRGHYPKTSCSYEPVPFCPADGYNWPCPEAQKALDADKTTGQPNQEKS